MKKSYIIPLVLILFACNKTSNQASLTDAVYHNGILGTGAVSNSGVNAPAGYLWSEAQHNTGNNTLSNQTTGYACFFNTLFNYHIADDFTVPAGQTWKISRISVYAFADPSNTFDALRIRLWNNKPSVPGAGIIFGDLSTNILSSSIDTLTYAIQNSIIPAPGVIPDLSKKIWKLTATVNISLPSGTYWLNWQAHTSNGSACYSPTAKVKGTRGIPSWNAMVYNQLNVWQDTYDVGSPVTLPWINQDFAFEIVYKY